MKKTSASAAPALLGPDGLRLRRVAHEGADRFGKELATWQPGSYSADSELLPELEVLRDRTRDVIRNHGIASGAVQTHVDNVIGSGLLLSAKPDRRVLGVKEDDAATNEALDELESEIEAHFDVWSENIGCYVDASRRSRFSGLLVQAYRTYLSAFEILASAEWLPGRGSLYATAVQMIDPARLSNPLGRQDSERMRAGVELGELGEPIAYHIANHVEGDFAMMNVPVRAWKRIPRETPWGRSLVMHVFDNNQPGQSRGKNGITSVLLKHKMVDKWEKSALEAAIFNAMYAAHIESSLDWPSVAAAIGADAQNDPTLAYLDNVAEFHREGNIRFNGLRVPHLYPGEKFEYTTPKHPMAEFASFEEAALRYLAAGWNLTYEQLSRDYSKTNYSSARAAMLEAWRFFGGKQYLIGGWFATLVYALWLEEAFDKGVIVAPPGVRAFWESSEAKTAWTTCEWIGPGRGHVDPLKEENARKVKFSTHLTNLEAEAALDGRRWRDLLRQESQEQRFAKKLGLDISSIGGASPAPPGEERDDENRDDRRADPAAPRRNVGT